MKNRAAIQELIEQEDFFADVDIKQVAKEAKLGWLKTLIIVAIWPILKKYLATKVNPKIIEVIDKLIQMGL